MTKKLWKDDLYSVGILNPNLRVFDIVMHTEYGTSYNSYLIKDEKTALFETAHISFLEEYLDNIREVTSLEDIDYIVLNHTEPDHTGVLKELLELCPNAKVVCSRAASIYIKSIVNEDMDLMVVRDGDSLSLGKYTLKFIMAPFLHWPDTMFTYIDGMRTVITCDFLGSHYCEPNMVDTKITYPEKYKEALKAYYDAIMSPFKGYVLAGLDKLSQLDYDTALVSHGPILTEDGLLGYVRDCYKEWSASSEKENLLLPIFYCSAYGYTKALALAAQATILERHPTAKAEVYDIIKYDMDYLASIMNSSDGFMIGSPTINKDAVPPVWELLSRLDGINNQKKPAGVFGSYGWSGEGIASMVSRLKGLKLNVAGEGYKALFNPSDSELAKMKDYTKEFLAEVE